MPIVTLDADFVANHLVCPEGKTKIEYVSHERTGLYILVSAASPGVGTWFVRFKNAEGRTVHHKLARSTEMDLDTARQKTREIKAQLVLGQDPHAEKAQRRKLPTLNDFVAYEYTAAIRTRKRTWQKDLERYRIHIQPRLGGRRLQDIKKPHIQALHTSVREKGLSGASADHVLKVIRQIFSLAIDYEYVDKNPAMGVKQYNVDNRVERYLDDQELRRLLQVLERHPNKTVSRLIKLLLCTGARLREACQAKVADISLKNRVWRIPATHSKSKKIRAVPLNDEAVRLIEELEIPEGQEFLFVNPRTEKPYTSLHKAWSRIRAEAGLEDCRLHDLRHSFISYMLQNGRTLYEAQLVAGHSSSVVTERYAHLSMQSLQDAANAASAVITRASQSTETTTE